MITDGELIVFTVIVGIWCVGNIAAALVLAYINERKQ